MTPRQREIVLIPVPFTDLSSVKRRPVLVLSGDSHNRRAPDVLVAAITSHLAGVSGGGAGVEITAADLESGTLRVRSRVRADKLYTLSKGIIVKSFGRLKPAKFAQVLAALDAVLER